MWLSRRHYSILFQYMKPKSTAGRNTAVQVRIVFYAVNTRCCQSSARSKYALVSAPADCCGREIHYEENIYSSLCCTLLSPTFSDRLDQGPTKVEFFERIYQNGYSKSTAWRVVSRYALSTPILRGKRAFLRLHATPLEKNLDENRTTRGFLCDYD